ncbi:MAG: CoA pyrophosphatase [Pseudomonadota bacterium]
MTLKIYPAPEDDPLFVDFLARAGRLPDTPLGAPPSHGDLAPVDERPGADGARPRDAAVLFVLAADAEGELSLLLTERAAHLSSHAGQVALPGGKIETGETAVAAALREASEEVGLTPDASRVVGLAPPYLTRTGYLVSPVLAVLTRQVQLQPDPGEVASTFLAPYRHVMTLANHREVEVVREGWPRRYFEVMVGQRRVWGVTAGILRMVHEKLHSP